MVRLSLFPLSIKRETVSGSLIRRGTSAAAHPPVPVIYLATNWFTHGGTFPYLTHIPDYATLYLEVLYGHEET
jgi:hypothetical protein